MGTDTETMLEDLGLSKTEAKVYLCLLDEAALPAATIADRTGTSRSSVYLILRSLVDKGLIDAGAGYSSRYHAAPPGRALGALLERERLELENRKQQVDLMLPGLTAQFEQNARADGELVEILRTPSLVGERFDRLQSEARTSIDIVVRGPLQVGGPNDAEVAALRRGVRARAIYDDAILADPVVARNLAGWTSEGEQARVYPGALPMKFALFDAHTVVMPLVAPGVTGVVAIIVRNHELAAALEFLFDTLWTASTPLKQV
ncbi:TrmB family transcriptional regulator [Kribbella sp. NPDC048928]|uniref:TrmB family transcriptional regulator n=1 Tax=Kribbella sp. NPDC048928 TaxID=3364111 RepID=UPI003718218F